MASSWIIFNVFLVALGVNSWTLDHIQDILQRHSDDTIADSYDLNDISYDEGLNENTYENEEVSLRGNEIMEPKRKKSTICTVKKVLRTHPQDGYEYHPKHYHEYECVPLPRGIIEVDFAEQDKCFVEPTCQSVNKYGTFLKRKIGERCWNMEKVKLNAGCKCISSVHVI